MSVKMKLSLRRYVRCFLQDFGLIGTVSMSTAHSRRNIAAFNLPCCVCANCNRSALFDSMLPARRLVIGPRLI